MTEGALAVVNGRDVVTVGEGLTESAVVRMWLGRVASISRSQETQVVYQRALRRFSAWREGADLLTTTRTDALRYAEHLMNESGLGAASQAQALSAMRSLFGFAVDLGVITFSPFAVVRTPKVATEGAPRMLTQEEVKSLLAAATPKGRALVLLLATTGLRISEALDATWAHLFTDPTGNTGLRVVGKGGKVRDVKMLPQVVEALKPFKVAPDGYLMPNRDGGRMSKQSADQMLAGIAKRAGIGKAVSAHWLRHYLATQALAAGAPLLQVQKDLGHAALATTQRYLHAAQGLAKTSADYAGDGLV